MKKLLLILSVVFMFASCSDDDSNVTQSDIAGKWSFSRVWYQVDATSPEVKASVESEKVALEKRAKNGYIEFTEEGKFSNSYEGFYNLKYYIKGNSIYYKEYDEWDNWRFNLNTNT